MKYCEVWCISLNCTIHIVCQRQWRGKVFWYFLSLVGYFIARIVCVAWKLVNLKHLSDKRFKNLGWILWQTKNILNLHASSHVCGLSQSLLYHIMSSVVYYKLCCLWYVWYLLGKDAFTSLVALLALPQSKFLDILLLLHGLRFKSYSSRKQSLLEKLIKYSNYMVLTSKIAPPIKSIS